MVLRSDRLQSTDLGEDGGVLLDIEGNQILTLNRMGMYLIERLREDGGDVEALTQRVARDFAIEAGTARSDIEEFLARLAGFLALPGASQ